MATESNLRKIDFGLIREQFISQTDKETFEKECSFARQHFQKNPRLLECDPNTVMQAVLNVAQCGLTLNPVMKLAYLIPRWTKNGMCCALDPSYQGLVKLITDTGSVGQIYANLVRAGDDFSVLYGTTQEIIHKPKFNFKEPIEHAYAVAVLPNGNKQFEIMNITELHEIRDRSEGYKSFVEGKTKSAIWVDNEGEMCRKTVIKRLTKYLPKTDRWEQLARTVDIDNEDYTASEDQRFLILSLLERVNAQLEEQQMKALRVELSGDLTSARASEIINYLKDPEASFSFKFMERWG